MKATFQLIRQMMAYLLIFSLVNLAVPIIAQAKPAKNETKFRIRIRVPIPNPIKIVESAAKTVGNAAGAVVGAAGSVVQTAVETTQTVVEKTVETTVDAVKETADAAVDVGKAAVDVGQSAVNVGEAVANLATGDLDSAKNALGRANENIGEGLERTYDGFDGLVQASADVAQGTFDVATYTFDAVSGAHTNQEYHRVQKRVSKEIQRSAKKVGAVLDVMKEPQNLGKVVLISVASATMGPYGAALANVMYDKIILKKPMSEGDMLKSFVVGAAAGYAAQYAQGAAQGSQLVEQSEYAKYIAKAASGMAKNTTTGIGNALLKGDSYGTQAFFSDLATGAATTEIGDSFGANVLEATAESAMDNVTEQAIEKGLGNIDWEEVDKSLYEGFGQALTQEAVDGLVNQVMPENWKHQDEKINKAFVGALTAAWNQLITYQQEQRQVAVLKALVAMDEQDRIHVVEKVEETKQNALEATLGRLGKSEKDLTKADIESDNFQKIYSEELNKGVVDLYNRDAHFAQLVADSQNLQQESNPLLVPNADGRGPAGAAENLSAASSAAAPVLTLLEGGAAAEAIVSTFSVVSAIGGKLIPVLGPLLPNSTANDDDKMPLQQGQPLTPPASGSDDTAWELYNRALRNEPGAVNHYNQYLLLIASAGGVALSSGKGKVDNLEKAKESAKKAQPVSIPWGSKQAVQEFSDEALISRLYVENGGTLYRIGTRGISNTGQNAQFWASEHPSTSGFAQKYGIPPENMKKYNFIETAKLKEGGNFVTRIAPPVESNAGGGIEVVVPEGGVEIIGHFSIGEN